MSVVLIRLPALFDRTGDPIAWILALAPFWIVIALQLFVGPLRRKSQGDLYVRLREGLPAFAFMAVILAAFARAASSAALTQVEAAGHMLLWTTVTLFSLVLFNVRSEFGAPRVENLRGLVMGALVIYVLVNVGLKVAGFESQKLIYSEALYRPATILAVLGIQTERTLFPMAAGITSFGTVAGAALVGSMLRFLYSETLRRRAWTLAATVVAAYAILLTDARAAMLYVLLSVALVVLAPRVLRAVAGRLPLLSTLIPVTLIAAAAGLSRVEQAQVISRSGADLATLNSRTMVWRAGLTQVQLSGSRLLFGYGHEGHYTSRVSELYRERFQSFVNPDRIGLHNASLQFMIDLGIIGAALFLICFSRLLTVLAKEGEEWNVTGPVFGTLIYLLLAGATDSVPTPYSQELFLAFTVLLISSSAVKPVVPSHGPED